MFDKGWKYSEHRLMMKWISHENTASIQYCTQTGLNMLWKFCESTLKVTEITLQIDWNCALAPWQAWNCVENTLKISNIMAKQGETSINIP